MHFSRSVAPSCPLLGRQSCASERNVFAREANLAQGVLRGSGHDKCIAKAVRLSGSCLAGSSAHVYTSC